MPPHSDRIRITSITVGGFKSISERRTIELRPITVLAGANSSGKSSFVQPLLLLKQTLDSSIDAGPLRISGPNVQFTSTDQLLSRTPRETRGSSLFIGFGLNGSRTFSLEFVKGAQRGMKIKEWTATQDGRSDRWTPAMKSDDVRKTIPSGLVSRYESLFSREGFGFKWEVRPDRCFFNLVLSSERSDQPAEVQIGDPGYFLSSAIRRVIHLPGLRGNPERTYPLTTAKPRAHFEGTFDVYVASVISNWQQGHAGNKINDLRLSLEQLGLTWKAETKPIDDTQVEIRVGRLPHATQGGAWDLVNIADVGVGVSQSLPVLVALIEADPDQIVFVEQPEIHLHPRAQVRLARIIAQAARRGVQVVIETHSSLLLMAIQTLVAEGEYLDAEQVILHWFTRDHDGQTEIASATLDESGAFGNWPEDFGEIELALQDRYLNASEPKLPGFE